MDRDGARLRLVHLVVLTESSKVQQDPTLRRKDPTLGKVDTEHRGHAEALHLQTHLPRQEDQDH
jgi:hypothetical protein